MKKITRKISINAFGLIYLLLLCSLFTSENAFSRQNWNGDFTKVTYNPNDNTITFKFEVFDYFFGPLYENGFLRWCDFDFTQDGRNYIHLMRAETGDQGVQDWTWLKMRYKNIGTQLVFLGCYKPAEGTIWPDTNDDVNVEVYNDICGMVHRGTSDPKGENHYKAFFTVKWLLGDKFKDVKRIRLNGFWKVNGAYEGDDITNVYYDIPSKSMLKSPVKQSENSRVKVTTEADAIVVTGAALGENVKVYTVEGTEVQSIVTNNDVVNIKLPKNQIYLVNIGKARYKVAL